MELNTKYEITDDPNLISGEGVIEIDKYLSQQDLPYPLGLKMGVWIKQKGPYRGKLPNRLSALYKDRHNIKLTPEQRTAIGNIAKRFMVPDEKYKFDFTDTFDWIDGDFGDHGSCFWDDQKGARGVMMEAGVIAIRFYRTALELGFGRAWLFPLDNETWILFNAYGLTTEIAARVLAEYLTQDTSEQWSSRYLDSLTVAKEDGGLVYINACPRIVFVEGSGPPEKVDLNFPRYCYCFTCDTWVRAEDAVVSGSVTECRDCWLME